MPTFCRLQVTLLNDNALLRDAAVNTWHYGSAGDRDADTSAFVSAISAFYNAIDSMFSSCLSGIATWKAYDLADVEPRVPFNEDQITFTPGAGTQLPNEVAVCMSFHGTLGSGINAARRRGRIYLGPLDANIVDNLTQGAIIDSATEALVAGAAETLRDVADTSDASWVVFSPTSYAAVPSLATSCFPVVGGHVDNAFDTIRSRGIDSTSRTLWP